MLNSKLIFSLIILLVLSAPILADNSYYAIGHGIKYNAANLDVGSGGTGRYQYSEDTGFVPPRVSMPLVLSPGAQVYQAGKMVDEARAIRSDVSSAYNGTLALSAKVKEDAGRAEDAARDAKEGARSSGVSAARIENDLNRTILIMNETSRRAEELGAEISKAESVVEEIRDHSEANKEIASMLERYLSETYDLYNRTLELSEEAKASAALARAYSIDAKSNEDACIT